MQLYRNNNLESFTFSNVHVYWKDYDLRMTVNGYSLCFDYCTFASSWACEYLIRLPIGFYSVVRYFPVCGSIYVSTNPDKQLDRYY